MAIKDLLELLSEVNIAEDILEEEGGEQRLMLIGREVKEGYGADWDSMADWRDDIDKGLELIKPATGPRDEPWQGAANFKTPLLMEARLKFGDRAGEELLGNDQLVKAKVIGKDPDDEKADRVERIEAVMNWQLTVENDSWVEEQDKLLYNLADQGAIFKKTSFDPALGHNVSEVITYPNFAINQDTKTLDTALRFTHSVLKTPNQIQSMINSGVWLEDTGIEFGAIDTDKDITEAVNDKLTQFYEQQTFLDLDDDGIDEPYIVTVHASSGTVMRIKAQFALDDIFVRDNEGLTTTVDLLIDRDDEGNPIIDDDEIQLIDPDKDRTIIKITREKNLTNYSFLTNPQGEFLSVGYFHILGSYAQGINTTTNQLLDAGTLANLPTGWLAKGFRKKMGDTKLIPGSLNQTNLSAQDLQTGILMNTFREPSQTLMALNNQMTLEAQRLSSTTDLGSVLGQNTPAATALGVIQDQQQATDAIILRIYRSMTREFSIWFRLNAKFMDPQQYTTLLDDEEADPLSDFSSQDMGIVPAANPRNSSKPQRIQKAHAQMSILPQIRETGGDPKPVIKAFLEAVGSENVDQIYPELTPEQLQAQQEEQKRVQAMEEQLRFLPVKAQADIGEAEKLKAQVNLLDAETKRMKQQTDSELTEAKVINTEADTFLKAEQAETEGTKNATNIVNTELNIQKAEQEAEQTQLDRGQVNAPRPNTGVV